MLKMTFLFFILLIQPAFAYVDPGTGSMFIQAIIALILVIPFYIHKIISFFKNLISKNNHKDGIDD